MYFQLHYQVIYDAANISHHSLKIYSNLASAVARSQATYRNTEKSQKCFLTPHKHRGFTVSMYMTKVHVLHIKT